MKRLAILIPVGFSMIILLAACSGFFTNEGINADKGQIAKLAVSGGGYLSTDDYNEITPYLFRDASSDEAWLFYSSDQDGNYNIYFAKLNGDGSFQSPTKMNTYVNSTYDELSPVVYKATSSAAGTETNTYISYIRANGSTTNVYTARLNAAMDGFANATAVSIGGYDAMASGIGIAQKETVPPLLLLSTNGSKFITVSWNMYSSPVNWSSTTSKDINITTKVRSCNQWTYGLGSSYAKVYFYDNNTSGKYQLYGAYEGTTTNEFDLDAYDSSYNDRDPSVDQKTKQVYFASDRFGNGNYDLYRYNVLKASVAVATHILNLVYIPPIATIDAALGGSYITIHVSYNYLNTNKIVGFIIYRRNVTLGDSFREVGRLATALDAYYYDYDMLMDNTYEYYARPYYEDIMGAPTTVVSQLYNP